jgi:hypothetical protein
MIEKRLKSRETVTNIRDNVIFPLMEGENKIKDAVTINKLTSNPG